MQAMFKSELAKLAGVSSRTFRRYLATRRPILTAMGVSPFARKLPPQAVHYISEDYCIDIPPCLKWLLWHPSPLSGAMGWWSSIHVGVSPYAILFDPVGVTNALRSALLLAARLCRFPPKGRKKAGCVSHIRFNACPALPKPTKSRRFLRL